MKFVNSYYKPGKQIISLQVLNQKVSKNFKKASKYIYDLYCPSCHKARLSYVNKTANKKAYLRTVRNSKHQKNCTYNFVTVSKRYTKQYFKTLSSTQVQVKMLSVMRSLSKAKNSSKKTKRISKNIIANLFSLPAKKNKTSQVKILRQKKLNGYLRKNQLQNKLFLFYGEDLYLKTANKKTAKNFDYLELHKNISSKIYVRVPLPITMSNTLKSKINSINNGKKYTFIAIGRLKFLKNYSPDLILINANALIFQ